MKSNTSAEVTLGTSFIDRFVKAIVPQTRLVILKNVPSVAILSVDLPHGKPERSGFEERKVSNKSQDTNAKVIPPESRTFVSIQTKAYGLLFWQTATRNLHK